jgi:hypothetical protein
MKKLTLLGAFLMLGAITNKGFAQTITAEANGVVISVNSDKQSGLVYSTQLGRVITFVNETLVDVLPGESVVVITPGNESTEPSAIKGGPSTWTPKLEGGK